MDRKYLRIKGAAEVAKISPWTIRRYLTDGKLTRYKIGGSTLVDEAELFALIQPEQTGQATARNVKLERSQAERSQR